MGKEDNGWNREAKNGKRQEMETKNADANVAGGGSKGDELQNPVAKGEQWEESGGAERKRTRNESHGGGCERTTTKTPRRKNAVPDRGKGGGRAF